MEISEQIRQRIADSGISARELARQVGISYPVITRFMARERSLSSDSIDALCRHFRLELAPAKRSKRSKK